MPIATNARDGPAEPIRGLLFELRLDVVTGGQGEPRRR